MVADDNEILAFLGAIDGELVPIAAAGETLDLHLLGRSALILGYGVRLMTKDVDVVLVHDSKLLAHALATFGKDKPRASRYDLYLEDVSSGLPPLPQGYQARSSPIPGSWRVLRPFLPEIHDLAASKLSRFHPKDREDVRVLCDTGGMTVEGLRSAVDSAFLFFADEDEDPRRKKAYQNLKLVVDYLEGRRRNL